MSDDDEEGGGGGEDGVPGWIVTFSDLMSLLLAFFVLLFAFSTIDKVKYKIVGGSVREAFGVQREVRVFDPVKGVTFISTSFSAGRPEMTLVNQLKQKDTAESKNQDVNTPSQSKSDTTDSLNRMSNSMSSEQIVKKPSLLEKSDSILNKKAKSGHLNKKLNVNQPIEVRQQQQQQSQDQQQQKQKEQKNQEQQDKSTLKSKQESKKGEEQSKSADTLQQDTKQRTKDSQQNQQQNERQSPDDTQKDKQSERDNNFQKILLQAEKKDRAIVGENTRVGKSDFQQVNREKNRQKVNGNAQALRLLLGREITQGYVDVLVEEGKLIIRLTEKGSFRAGSDELIGNYRPIIYKIASVLKSLDGSIQVAGHSDSSPITTPRFSSNWGLSAARAVTVAQELLSVSEIPEERFQVQGYSDTRPIDTNVTAKGRARNRRVEIVVMPPEPPDPNALENAIDKDQVSVSAEESMPRKESKAPDSDVAIPPLRTLEPQEEIVDQEDNTPKELTPSEEIRSLRRKDVTIDNFPDVGKEKPSFLQRDFIFGRP